MSAAIAAALAAKKPELAAMYVARARYAYEEAVRAFGPSHRGVYNSGMARNYKALVAPNCTSLGNRIDSENVLDEVKLARNAERYADAVATEWEGKLVAKLAELEDATCHALDGMGFYLTGTRLGHKVAIEQSMILNVSVKGTLFNQWPARIRIDGKASSEAKYRKLQQA